MIEDTHAGSSVGLPCINSLHFLPTSRAAPDTNVEDSERSSLVSWKHWKMTGKGLMVSTRESPSLVMHRDAVCVVMRYSVHEMVRNGQLRCCSVQCSAVQGDVR